MKYCNLCKVDIDTNHEFCPLCYNHLTEVNPKQTPEALKSTSDLPPYKKKMNMTAKVFLMLSIIVICVSVFVNFITRTCPWSVVVALSVIYLWVLVRHTIISHDTLFKKILLELVSLIALLVSTNLIFGGNDWLVSYVFPGIALAVSASMSFGLCVTKTRKNYVFSCFGILILLLIVSGIFLIFDIGSYVLLNQICVITEGLLIVSYLIFGGKTILREAQKKFHI